MPNPIRVLWLDSDERTVAQGRWQLVQQGWAVDQARNLVEALDRMSQTRYDAVILDIQLPDTIGTDAWVYLRRLQTDLIGIMTTRSSSLLHLIRIDAPGIEAYLLKPLKIDQVITIITNALNGPSPPAYMAGMNAAGPTG